MTQSVLAQQQTISRLFNQQKLPHALAISCAHEIEQRAFANWLGSLLICDNPQNEGQSLTACQQCKSCLLLGSATHPDQLQITHDERYIGIEQIRKITSFFEKTALLGKRKVAIIFHAEQMTESAANALLKTLEEPTNNSFILLTCNDFERLLPTIKSRCQLIELRQSSEKKAQNLVSASYDKLSDEQRQFNALFLSFLACPTQRSELTNFMLSHVNALDWGEHLMINLMRNQANWLNLEEFTKLEQQTFERLKLFTHDEIWHIYELICQSKKQLITVTQVNRQFLLEKLTAALSIFLSQAIA